VHARVSSSIRMAAANRRACPALRSAPDGRETMRGKGPKRTQLGSLHESVLSVRHLEHCQNSDHQPIAQLLQDVATQRGHTMSQKGSSALSSFGSAVRSGAVTAVFENSSRSDVNPSSSARPISTGQPKKRSYSGRSALRAWANTARIGRMLRMSKLRCAPLRFRSVLPLILV
jgi:hypothetical protein